MDPGEKFIFYLEKHPEFYSIAQSELYIGFLAFIARGNTTIEDIKKKFKRIEANDIYLIIESLVTLKLVKKTKAGQAFVYTATNEAKEFLKKYVETKKHFAGE